jgi:predicted dehydrogenase
VNIGIVGCGLIGHKRAKALGRDHRVVAVADTVIDRAESLARASGATVSADWRRLIANEPIEAVIVATTNDQLTPVALAAVEAGKHVLVEKPAARNPDEIAPLIDAARLSGVHVQVGYNHRFHPALGKAREIVDTGALGPLMYIRGRYGHGGRLGYEKEWRANPDVAGGGEMLDQGVHLIDLSRWFLGDFESIAGEAHTYFWDMPVEDNGFMLLRTPQGQVAFLHASCTEWKNLFSFEIYGRHGKLHIDGLGGSYGTERLSYYRMLPAMGPPETTIWEYPGDDVSFRLEFEAFAGGVRGQREGLPNLADARAALEIVHRIYGAGRFTRKPL